jgi:hypothetical protein
MPSRTARPGDFYGSVGCYSEREICLRIKYFAHIKELFFGITIRSIRLVKSYLCLKKLIIDRSKVVNLEEDSVDVLLLCYVDNELDADQRAAVEKLLAHDPAARQKVAQIRRLNMLLKAAYSDDGERN